MDYRESKELKKALQKEKERALQVQYYQQWKDKLVSIDEKLNEARQKINWTRRNEAESDICKWIVTYVCDGLLLDEPPPPKGEEILKEMWTAIFDSRPYLICQARGSGKTSYIESIVLAALAQGKRDFFVLVSQNVVSAQNLLNDIFRVVMEQGPFAQDYPDLSLPFQCNSIGSFRRRQTFNGVSTDICKNASRITFARLKNEDGTEAPTSQACVVAKGIEGGLRGLKFGTKRPSCVVLDDIQTDQSAESPSTVEKLYTILNKSILNLGGKGKIAVLQSATPINSDDLVQRLREDKAWRVSIHPAIIKWPVDILKNPNDGLWFKYFQLYDEENALDIKHEKSLKFYKRHQKKMDKGAEVLNPNRFKIEDGHLSAIQSLLEKQHMIGNAAFACEYQMSPKVVDAVLNITPKMVLEKICTDIKRNVIPDGYTSTWAALDLNTSFAISCVVGSFKPDGSCATIKHKISPCKIDQKLPDVVYNQKLYEALTKFVKSHLTQFDLNGIVIDGGGRNFDTVCEWCKHSKSLVGIPALCLLGKASHQFNPLVKTRLRNAVGRTVLCGDEMEHVKRNAGKRWMFFDSDHFREAVQRSILSPIGSPGGTVLYNDLPVNHSELAAQLCNEIIKWKKTKPDGRVEYHWKSKDPHDLLDCFAELFAIACFEGISTSELLKRHNTELINSERQRNIRKLQMLRRQKVRIA